MLAPENWQEYEWSVYQGGTEILSIEEPEWRVWRVTLIASAANATFSLKSPDETVSYGVSNPPVDTPVVIIPAGMAVCIAAWNASWSYLAIERIRKAFRRSF